MQHIKIIGISGIPIIKKGDNLAQITLKALKKIDFELKNGDILVFSHVIVSRSEGKVVDLKKVTPSIPSLRLSETTGKDPRLVEVVLQEARSIRRVVPGVLITETKEGFVCANSGVDKSNVPGKDFVAPLPDDSDVSATRIRNQILFETGLNIAVIISDTHGRAHREGEINVSIGASGLNVIEDRRGKKDLFGYELKIKRTAIADELASAGELVIGQSDEGIPIALIRGYKYSPSETSNAKELVRPRDKDLFK